jgi:hypothetical protein
LKRLVYRLLPKVWNFPTKITWKDKHSSSILQRIEFGGMHQVVWIVRLLWLFWSLSCFKIQNKFCGAKTIYSCCSVSFWKYGTVWKSDPQINFIFLASMKRRTTFTWTLITQSSIHFSGPIKGLLFHWSFLP